MNFIQFSQQQQQQMGNNCFSRLLQQCNGIFLCGCCDSDDSSTTMGRHGYQQLRGDGNNIIIINRSQQHQQQHGSRNASSPGTLQMVIPVTGSSLSALSINSSTSSTNSNNNNNINSSSSSNTSPLIGRPIKTVSKDVLSVSSSLPEYAIPATFEDEREFMRRSHSLTYLDDTETPKGSNDEEANEEETIKAMVTRSASSLSSSANNSNISNTNNGNNIGNEKVECMICFDSFSESNPNAKTICACEVNKTAIHLPCLVAWKKRSKKQPVCVNCNSEIYFDEALFTPNQKSNINFSRSL